MLSNLDAPEMEAVLIFSPLTKRQWRKRNDIQLEIADKLQSERSSNYPRSSDTPSILNEDEGKKKTTVIHRNKKLNQLGKCSDFNLVSVKLYFLCGHIYVSLNSCEWQIWNSDIYCLLYSKGI